jgi:hypothetical protein
MTKTFVAVIGFILVAGCAHHPSGTYQWRNDDLYAKIDSGTVSREQADHEFLIAKSACKIEALKVPVPSPSCTQVPPCTRTGYQLGLCAEVAATAQHCNYSSVNAATEAQGEIFESCLFLAGWRKIWVPDSIESPVGPKGLN